MPTETKNPTNPPAEQRTPTTYRDEVMLICDICDTPFPKGGICPNVGKPKHTKKKEVDK